MLWYFHSERGRKLKQTDTTLASLTIEIMALVIRIVRSAFKSRPQKYISKTQDLTPFR